jgi:glycosyltransferase involved in cell wall biosynthesis
MKVSFVCTTYRRFRCVERVIAQYYAQTYDNIELIIFNTDTEYPLELNFDDENIILVNNSIDYDTKLPYIDRGKILKDAVSHTTGDLFMLADDDDIYLPWHIQQAVDMITLSGKDAWKPQKSFFQTRHDDYPKIELSRNIMEASIIVKMFRINQFGFNGPHFNSTGQEGLHWYMPLRNLGHLNENDNYCVPSYGFNWGDPPDWSPHKQSGDIHNPNNFENHKRHSKDYATRPLSNNFDLVDTYDPYFNFYKEHRKLFDSDLMKLYVNDNLGRNVHG